GFHRDRERRRAISEFRSARVLRFAVADRDGRLLRRSLLRRQSRHGGMEDDRLSRPARRLPTRDGTFARPASSPQAALHRRLRIKLRMRVLPPTLTLPFKGGGDNEGARKFFSSDKKRTDAVATSPPPLRGRAREGGASPW